MLVTPLHLFNSQRYKLFFRVTFFHAKHMMNGLNMMAIIDYTVVCKVIQPQMATTLKCCLHIKASIIVNPVIYIMM